MKRASRLPELLLDHANCELKAASTALGYIYRYPEKTALVSRMSRIAREELQALRAGKKNHGRDVDTIRATSLHPAMPDHYAMQCAIMNRKDCWTLLLVGALIEARSCERFAALLPHLPEKLEQVLCGAAGL